MKKNILIFCLLALIIGCKNAKENKCVVIDLATGINEESASGIKDLNDIADVEHMIPIETNDSSLLVNALIAGVSEKNIGIYDSHSFFVVNKENGRIISRVQKAGDGPEEYACINQAKINSSGLVYIADFHRKRINIYNPEGKWLKYIENDSINRLDILDNGDFVTTASTNSPTKYNIAIYDSLWNLKRCGLPKKDYTHFAIIYSESTAKYNNELYFKSIIGDTIYHITPEADKPYLVFNKGNYRMPDELRTDLSKMDAEKQKYINSESVLIASEYLFINYSYAGKRYYDIWNIETSALLYRSVFSPAGGKPGIPLLIKNKTVNVWPYYASGDYLYCTLEDEVIQTLLPTLPEDNNPVILELKIKTHE